jgi:2-oxoglutarate dehydrogenase complex dehydrogenase (E1) component-like enzyme
VKETVEAAIGMSHRGRSTVLAKIMKSYKKIFRTKDLIPIRSKVPAM